MCKRTTNYKQNNPSNFKKQRKSTILLPQAQHCQSYHIIPIALRYTVKHLLKHHREHLFKLREYLNVQRNSDKIKKSQIKWNLRWNKFKLKF